MKEIKWNDRFNVGVDIIDSAHKKLFSIVGKLIALNEGESKQQHACWEGILCILCTDITAFFAPGLPLGSKGKACTVDRRYATDSPKRQHSAVFRLFSQIMPLHGHQSTPNTEPHIWP